jgi:hypothetical protein
MEILFSLKFVLYVIAVNQISVGIGSQENYFIAACIIKKGTISQ